MCWVLMVNLLSFRSSCFCKSRKVSHVNTCSFAVPVPVGSKSVFFVNGNFVATTGCNGGFGGGGVGEKLILADSVKVDAS